MDINKIKIGLTKEGKLIVYRANKKDPNLFTEFRDIEGEVFSAITDFVLLNNPETGSHKYKLGNNEFEIFVRPVKLEDDIDA